MRKSSVSITEGEKDCSGGWGEMNGPVVIVKESEGRTGFVEEKMLEVEEAGVVITVTDTAADFEIWKLFEDV
ncbi:uncharacterized protein B0T23DRAFT_405499 [Neurospora hispaniola]|uniref:Uncharacterized protein n=1 Tax=Neurospora hispaniola TaxID=588809 RepID=A0AAJ0I5L1_9PEZI|nr:hypothetical protein B0T23DRAFT_405499 [Neurospora hispaniola]